MYRNRKAYAYTTQREIRRAFWEQFPNLSRRKIGPPEHRSYTTDTRCAFVDFIDGLHREGSIPSSRAKKPRMYQKSTIAPGKVGAYLVNQHSNMKDFQ